MTDAGAAERGIALLNLGRPKDAEQYFRDALAAEPTDPDLLVYLAQSLHRQARYDEALEAARQAVAADPTHVAGLAVLSAAHAGREDFPSALDALRRGLRLAPTVAALHRQEGVLLIAQDRAVEAFGPLERARALDPEDADTVATIGAALYEARRFPEADQAVAEALRLDPDNVEAHRLLGLLQLRRGGGKSAVDAHRTALRLDPTDPSSRHALATAMKTRNPLYGQLVRFGAWMDGLPSGARWGILLAPLILNRVLRPFDDRLWAQVLIVVVVALVVLSWALEPIMNTVLLLSSYARNLLPRITKLATYAFLAYVAAAVAAVSVGLSMESDRTLFLAFGLAVWSVTAGHLHTVKKSRRKVAIGIEIAGALLGALTVVTMVLGLPAAGALLAIFVFLGLAMVWFTAFA
jgi:tetratricopeptide (TPR) repeat protein